MKLIAEHSIHVAAPREAIWQKLVDFEHWTDWDTDMERVTFAGPLTLDSKGKLKLRSGVEGDLVITTWEESNRYVDEFRFLGSRYIFDHVLVSIGNVNEIIFSISVDGLFGELFSFLSARHCKKNLPIWMANFKTQLESETSNNLMPLPRYDLDM
jgi:hypothetical protein